jgi:2-oxoglutarate dehydrogenase E2 component (dihydrolipoamide succinyltransferase)
MALTEIIAPLEQEGTRSVVRKWLVAVGDAVAVNDPIVELETDKVSVEVAAEEAGVLAEIVLEPGAEAEPGAVLGRMKAGEGAAPAATPAAKTEPKSGLARPAGAGPAAVEPRRAIGSFDPSLRLSPSVRRRLVESDLDPSGLSGSGRGGRLTRADVDSALEQRASPGAKRAGEGDREAVEGASATALRPPSAPSTTPSAGRGPPPPLRVGGMKSIPHDSMRLRIAEHMASSLANAPHVTAVFEADFSAIMAHRRAHKGEFEKRGANLTLTAYIVAASVKAMDAAPTVNARWFEDRLEVYDDVNIGVGTALGDKGLVVPVVKQAQALDLFGIASKLHDLTDRARNSKLTPADVRDGTFSISNHGVSGSLIAAPIIINQPQSAILGVGKLEKRVVVREVDGTDAMLIRPMAYVSLSIDHRVLDGHQTNAWLTRFVEVLEGWSQPSSG